MTPSTPGRPGVSVIVPVHNRASIVGRALESILTQTFRDFEIIVIDDGSADNLRAAVAQFEDSRIRCVSLPHRRGAAAARNAGITVSRGEWIAFLDSDDEWLPQKLERQVAALEQPGFDAAYSACLRQPGDAPPEVRPKGSLAGGDVLDAFLARRHPITPSVVIVRRTALKRAAGFDEALPSAEDIDLWLRLASTGCRFAAIQDSLAIKHDSGTGQMKQDAVGKAIGFRKMDARWGELMRERLGGEAYTRWYGRRSRSIDRKQVAELERLAADGARTASLDYARRMSPLLPWSRRYVTRGLAVALAGRALLPFASFAGPAALPRE